MIFSQFLSRFRAGRLDECLTEELRSLTISANHFLKPAELNVKIRIVPNKQGDCRVEVKFSGKAPKNDTMEGVVYLTPEGNILDRDPKQEDMFGKLEVIEQVKNKTIQINN